jgi:acetyl-CoA acetyltransferase
VALSRYMKPSAPVGVAAMCAGGGMATALVLDMPG